MDTSTTMASSVKNASLKQVSLTPITDRFRGVTTFLDLPLEIRHKIYGFVCSENDHLETRAGNLTDRVVYVGCTGLSSEDRATFYTDRNPPRHPLWRIRNAQLRSELRQLFTNFSYRIRYLHTACTLHKLQDILDSTKNHCMADITDLHMFFLAPVNPPQHTSEVTRPTIADVAKFYTETNGLQGSMVADCLPRLTRFIFKVYIPRSGGLSLGVLGHVIRDIISAHPLLEFARCWPVYGEGCICFELTKKKVVGSQYAPWVWSKIIEQTVGWTMNEPRVIC